MSFALLYITHESKAKAEELTDHLLQKKIIACANIFPISSSYWWNAAIQHDDEWVSIVKTSLRLWEIVEQEVEKHHSYDVPCIIRMEVEANEAYEKWIEEACSFGLS
jgi:periplasmic divalent cation tolerance protein